MLVVTASGRNRLSLMNADTELDAANESCTSPATRAVTDGAVYSGRCYSACVYALMGAATRVAPPQSRVGIHRMGREREAGAGSLETPATSAWPR